MGSRCNFTSLYVLTMGSPSRSWPCFRRRTTSSATSPRTRSGPTRPTPSGNFQNSRSYSCRALVTPPSSQRMSSSTISRRRAFPPTSHAHPFCAPTPHPTAAPTTRAALGPGPERDRPPAGELPQGSVLIAAGQGQDVQLCPDSPRIQRQPKTGGVEVGPPELRVVLPEAAVVLRL